MSCPSGCYRWQSLQRTAIEKGEEEVEQSSPDQPTHHHHTACHGPECIGTLEIGTKSDSHMQNFSRCYVKIRRINSESTDVCDGKNLMMCLIYQGVLNV